MTAELNIVDQVKKATILERAQKAVKMEEAILDNLVAKYYVAPEDERDFRLGHRAQWRAVAALWAASVAEADPGSAAEYVEMLRDSTIIPLDTNDAERAAEFAELMRKIAA
jgi:hypothetical protein